MTKALADLFFGTKAAVVGFACFRIPMLVCLRGSRLEPYSEPGKFTFRAAVRGGLRLLCLRGFHLEPFFSELLRVQEKPCLLYIG